MASSGGKRAAGTDGQDFKYRQRVDNHYKIMATARKSLKSSGRLQLASALGLAGSAGVVFVLPTALDSATVGLCIVAAVVSSVTGKSGLGAAGAQQPEKQLASYLTQCKVQMGSAFTAVGMGGASVLAQGDAERSWVAVVCMFAAIGILGSFVGIRSGGDLSRAFEEQAKKKSGAGL